MSVEDRGANLCRDWVWLPGCEEGSAGKHADSFTLMNYNILADCHIKEGWYPYCPREFLKMADRHQQLLAEISHHSPDILCLQEVGPKYFAELLNPALSLLGYIGSFFKKVRGIQEGEATFYKTERFQKLEERGVVFNELVAEECRKSELPEKVVRSVMAYTNQDHIVLLTKLQDVSTGRVISIGNTHLLFDDYKNIDIITLQGGLAINTLVGFAGGPNQPHILCGDFNQEPMMAGYQLLHDGKLDVQGEDFIRQYPIKIGDLNKSLLDVLPQCFTHISPELQSAYKSVVNQEVSYTCYEEYLGAGWSHNMKLPGPKTGRAKGPRKMYISDPKEYGKGLYVAALDYQWFSSDSVVCSGVLDMVGEDQVKQYYACPNKVFPSDHISLLGRYSIRDD